MFLIFVTNYFTSKFLNLSFFVQCPRSSGRSFPHGLRSASNESFESSHNNGVSIFDQIFTKLL